MRSEHALVCFVVALSACTRAEHGAPATAAPEVVDVGVSVDANRDADPGGLPSYQVSSDEPYGAVWYGERPWTFACATMSSSQIVWIAMDDEIVAIDPRNAHAPRRKWPFAAKHCSITTRADGDGAYVVRRTDDGLELLELMSAQMPRRLALIKPYTGSTLLVETDGKRVLFGPEGAPSIFAYDLKARRVDTVPMPREPISKAERVAQTSRNRCALVTPAGEIEPRVLCTVALRESARWSLMNLGNVKVAETTESGLGHTVDALLPSPSGVWMMRGSFKTSSTFFAHHEVQRVVSGTAASP